MMMAHKENDHPQTKDKCGSGKADQLAKVPFSENRLMNPIERVSEILFGLIMALSFTFAINVAEIARIDVKEMLIAALG